MKKSLIALAALALSGCASLNNAGHTAYSVKPVAGGYELDARDGKEYSGDGRIVMFDAKEGTLVVQEGPSKAFKGQALAVKATSVLPTFVDSILAPGDK